MLECLKNCWKNVSEHILKTCFRMSSESLKKLKKLKKSWKKLKKVEKKLKKSWKMFLESSRIWCTKIMTWEKHLSSQMGPQKLSDQEQEEQEQEEQQQQQQTYVKDLEQEC